MTYRAALIGCGRIGSEFADDPRVQGIYSHAGAYAACSATTLVAVCDRDPDKVERCGERWGVSARYRDPHRLLEEQRPEIVSICTPDPSHHSLINAAITTPGVRAVLAEKPLALNMRGGREVVDLAERLGVVLAVNYSRRYADSHQRLRDFLHAGGIGTVQTVGGYYTKGTLHNGTHWFDLARFLVGEVVRVWGFDARGEIGEDPTLDTTLEFANEASGHLHGCDAAAFSLFEMDIIGTLGRVRVIDGGHRIETYTVVDSPHYTGYRTLMLHHQAEEGLADVLLHVVEDVVRCLEEGGRPRCSGADGLAALMIALAVRDSARSGRPVTLDPNMTAYRQ